MFTTPLIIYLFVAVFGLGIALAKHGEPRKGTYEFGTTLIGTLITIGLIIWHSRILLGW